MTEERDREGDLLRHAANRQRAANVVTNECTLSMVNVRVEVGAAPVAVVTSLLRAFTLIAQGASKERAAFSQPFLYAVRVTDARAHAEAVCGDAFLSHEHVAIENSGRTLCRVHAAWAWSQRTSAERHPQ